MSRAWILSKYPDPRLNDALILEERTLRPLFEDEVRVAVQFVSIDPGMRTWIREEGSYMPALPLGSPMPGSILGKVVETRSCQYAVGDLVAGMGEWADECILADKVLRRVPQSEDAINPLATLSVLGATGWTAYVGMIDVGRPVADDTVVISAAAGAVGSIAGQIARISGCRVVGIAGSDEKCAWITNELAFDAAINYCTENVGDRIDELCPAGVDIYFENVGGNIGNALYKRMAEHGRIVLCGLVAGYERHAALPELDLNAFLMKRVRIEGFNITDHFSRIEEINAILSEWITQGHLRHKTAVVDGLENCVGALTSLLSPGNRHRGKLLVRITPPT
jgi:hypothetical protein